MLKKISLYTGVSALNALIGLGVVLYLTHVLSPEQYAYLGIYSTLIFFFTPALSFSSISLVSINTVDLGDGYPKFANDFINFVILLFFIFLLIGSLVFVVIEIDMSYAKLSLLALVISFVCVLINIHYLELIYSQKSKNFAVYKILFAALSAGGTIIFITLNSPTWESRLYGLLMGAVTTLALMLVFTFQSFKRLSFNFRLKPFLTFGAPLMLGLGAAWLNTQADKFLVLKYFDKETLGFYSFGSSLGMAFIMVNQSIVNAIAPKIYSGLKEKKVRTTLTKYFYYSCGFIITVITFAEFVIYYGGEYLFGKEYINSIPIVQLILVSIIFNGAYRTHSLVLEYYKQNEIMTKIAYVVAFTNISLSLWLITIIGFYGPIIGTIAAWGINFILYYYFAKRTLKINQVL